MKVLNCHSHSAEATRRLAENFAAMLKPGDCVALQGDLGAGKTTFAKGVVSRLTAIAPEEIGSPTFTLIEEYRAGATPIYHVDLYRMTSPAEAENLPWDEVFAPEAISLIEWAERLPRLLPYCRYHLIFIEAETEDHRIIQITDTKDPGAPPQGQIPEALEKTKPNANTPRGNS
ncbi:MAG TPA: tRNA (adenosine(37)-N6)-threonylcarbamoyltransferase complex ATPase subunit type 1 TsaE [Deltaproteobacteria bacterium]|nr:tRNA (adenosine(37)-N6)-threonylcarbamoyltransferase complex ATPase subunit type 1 TsaE [Deltaproteobacteria bacterium]